MRLKTFGTIISSVILAIGLMSCGKHEHTIEEGWKNDETSHWHACTGCDEQLDKAEHTFSDWVTIKEPTCTEKGQKEKTCSVCNYKIVEDIAALGHKANEEWVNDKTSHWRICETCGEKVDVSEHTYTDWTIIAEPSCSSEGLKERTCSVCGYKEKEIIPKTQHEVQTEWSTSLTHHWHTCANCDEQFDKAEHSFTDWIVTKKATCAAKGERVKICSVCGYEIKEETPINDKGHEYLTGSAKIYRSPNVNDEGAIEFSCKNHERHWQYVSLPAWPNQIYKEVREEKGEDGYITYRTFVPERKNEVNALLDSLNFIDKTQIIDDVMKLRWYEREYCYHTSINLSWATIPTQNENGMLEIACNNCNYSIKIVVPVGSIRRYRFEINAEDNTKADYYIKDEATAKEILTPLDLFNFKVDYQETIDMFLNTKFTAPLFDLHIEAPLVTNTTDTIKFNVFTPRSPAYGTYTTQDTGITLNDTSKLRITFEKTTDCSNKVIKKIYLSEEALLELAQNEFGDVIGIDKHPDFLEQAKNIVVATPTPTQAEINANTYEGNMHTFGQITVLRKPTDTSTGLLEVKCKNFHKCGADAVIELPKLVVSDTDFYTATVVYPEVNYVVNDSGINKIITELRTKGFNAIADNETKETLKAALQFSHSCITIVPNS